MATRGTSAWWIEHYGKPCITSDHVALEWYPGVVTVVHRGTEPIWLALGAIYLAYNYKVPTSYTGSYSCRPVTGGGSWSGHAWPVAIDVNAKTNPYINHAGRRGIIWGVETDMPAAMINEIMKITAAGIRALTWGGFWRSLKDAMHSQLRVTTTEIAKGVFAPRGFYEGNGDIEMSLKKGDKGNAVQKHQTGLIAWNPNALPKFGADADFGGETETWVKTYQEAADLPTTGVIDGVTSALIISYTIEGGGVGKHSHPTTTKVTETTKVAVTIGEAG